MTTYELQPPTSYYFNNVNTAPFMLADLNGDGYPDLITSENGGLGVSFNDGRGNFYAGNGLIFGYGIVLVTTDLNGDGYPDYAVASYDSTTATSYVEVLLSNGLGYISNSNGNAAAPVNYADGSRATALALANLNGDGLADLVVTNSSGGFTVLLGTGGGAFSAPASYDTSTTFTSVIVTDLTGSGISDYVASVFGTGVDVVLGNGSGGFSAPVAYDVGVNPVAVKVADVNGDGIPDLLLLTSGTPAHYGAFGLVPAVPGEVAVLVGNGAGGFAAPVSYQAGNFSPRTLTIADLNGDGSPDLVVTNYGTGLSLTGGGVAVLLNDGTGNFSAETYYPVSYQPDAVAVLDVDRDGIADLVVGDQGGPAAQLLGTGHGHFAGPTYLTAVPSAVFAMATDVNGDGQPDLVTLNQIANEPVEVSLDGIACYCAGTLILAEGGEVPVERLLAGDRVMTISGALKPIRRIGRRGYSRCFLRGNRAILPIRFTAGCLGAGVPRRDLLVSPRHAMLLDGVLVPAECLVNGVSVVMDQSFDPVEYVHLELEQHDVVFAEGSPSETFMDDDSRGMFQNAAEFEALYPDAPAPSGFCAPRVDNGPELEAIRRRLVGASVHEVHLDGPGLHNVTIPAGASAVRLVTTYGYAPGDKRRLGAAVSRVVIDGVDTALSDASLGTGWHPCEGSWRWTDGAALLLAAGAREIEVTVVALPFAAAA